MTRNARAISAALSPATVFRVRATRLSRASAGWQQVKISRSRSSAIGSWCELADVTVSSMIATSASLARSVPRRRRTSRARFLATVVSHAAGGRGRPSRGQCASAFSTASWTLSSARSQSPVSRMRVATIAALSPATTELTASAVARCSGAVTRRAPRTAAARACRRWPADGARRSRWPRRGRRTSRCRSPRSTPGLRERPVGDQHLPLAHPDRGGVPHRAERVSHHALPAAVDVVEPLLDGEVLVRRLRLAAAARSTTTNIM